MSAAVEQQSDERITVNLKMLVGLAKTAAAIKLDHSAIKSMQSGGYISSFKGRGMEFDETRPYQPGDDIRSIDWRVTARTDKTHTKLFREERERAVFISVDMRPAMAFATRGVFKRVQAAKLAALLAWSAQKNGDRIGGQVFTDNDCRGIKPRNGKHGVLRLFHELVRHAHERTSSTIVENTLQHSIARLSRHIRPGSLVYLLSDFRGVDQACERYLSQLSRHCDVVLIMISDPLESHLPSSGRYRFTDKQRDVMFDTADKERVKNYQQRFQLHLGQVNHMAKKLGLAFYQCTTTDDPIQVLRRRK